LKTAVPEWLRRNGNRTGATGNGNGNKHLRQQQQHHQPPPPKVSVRKKVNDQFSNAEEIFADDGDVDDDDDYADDREDVDVIDLGLRKNYAPSAAAAGAAIEVR
jgi:hypothetical protein